MTLALVTGDEVMPLDAPSLSGRPFSTGGGGAVLKSGDHVLVMGEPVAGDGLWWVLVTLEEDPRSSVEFPLVAWIPAGTRSEPVLVADTGICPEPNLDALSTLSFARRIGCFGSRSVTLEAHQAAEPPDGGLGGACGERPAWLRCDNINYSWVNADGGTEWTFLLHFDPKTGIPELELAPAGTVGPEYRITGHFADPAAERCRPGGTPVDDRESVSAWVRCAGLFVVDSLDPID